MGHPVVGPVRPSEYEQLYELLWLSFERHRERDAWDWFRPFYENDPFMDEDLVRVVRDGGRIVASVTVFDRKVRLQGRTVRMGGIGNVATHPDFRGKGLAGVILDDCVALMKERNFDVSLLFAGPVPLYEKHGWTALDAFEYVFTGLRAPVPAAGLVCRPVSWTQERFKVCGLHRDFIARHNFPAERNPAYWHSYVLGFKNRTCGLAGVFRGDDLLAYVAVDHDLKERSVWIKELCFAAEDALPAVAAYLVRRYAPAKVRITASGRGNPAVAFFRGIADATSEDRLKGFMARNINAAFDMASDRFAEKILHFPGDDF